MANTRTLLKDLSQDETLSLDGGRFTITLEHKSGRRARLRIVEHDLAQDTAPPVPDRQQPSMAPLAARLGTKVAA